MSKSIVLTLTFFGKFPRWASAFFLSCKCNPDIHWIIFTDTNFSSFYSENVKFIKLSCDDFCSLVSSKLDIDVKLSGKFLYKICDFKPLFGLIYEEYLYQYDFWGHCDLDIIWGQIKNYITDDLLSNYDIITSRKKRISGHFCLYRNIYWVNSLFLSIPGVVKSLQKADTYQRLDEEFFTIYLNGLTEKKISTRIKKIFFPIQTPKIFWDKVLTTSGKSQRELIASDRGYFKWENGKVYDLEQNELMYIHFHILKQLSTFTEIDIAPSNSRIYVSCSGIHGC